jgi:uncharacterized membrane protein YoaK (UPF0700 family)
MKLTENLLATKQKTNKQKNMTHLFKMLTALSGGALITSFFITHSQNWKFYLPAFILSIGLFIYFINKEKQNNDTIRYN